MVRLTTMNTNKWVYFLALQALLLGGNAKLVPGLPKGPLPWGDINIIHTSDTHGWLLGHTKDQWPEPNYSGTLGDFASFVGHMKRIAEEKDVDLLVVDSGDLHDGSGLTDGYPLPGVNGHEAIKSFLKIPYDVMAIGNHELYVADVTRDVYNNFAPKLDGRYLSSNAYLLDSRSNGSSVEQIIGSRYRRFKTRRGRQVTSLGVIFNFKEHNSNTTVHNVASMVTETWFQELMLQPTDIFVIAGHMSVITGDWEIVSKEIQRHHPNTPIAILGGHTHTRFCRQLDANTMALESGRFLETVGWMSISLNGTAPPAPSFSRRYLDANRGTFMYHTQTTDRTFDSPSGLEIDMANQKLSDKWDLGKVHGCANQDYFVDRYEWPHPQNAYAFFVHKVIPNVLVKNWTRADVPYVAIINDGVIRFNIYRGLFTWNDQLTALPFKEGYRYITVPWSIARNVKDKLYEYPPDHFDVPSILAKEFGPAVNGLQVEDSVQRPLSLSSSTLSPGYVTEDKCGGNGDDTEHIAIPRRGNPLYMGNDPVYPIPDDHPVDIIVPEFIRPRTIEAINKLSKDRVYTSDDALPYGTVRAKEMFARYFENFPPGKDGCANN